ncbi:MAG: hypothetical protein EXQ79_08590 [Acidimicrobiia bacterium]|nr:hypothetical protein [Acidimicrobiia bacterium]
MVDVVDTSHAPPDTDVESKFRTRPPSRRSRVEKIALWSFRTLLLVPFVLMGPEIISYLLGQPGAATDVAESTADVFGTCSLLLMALMLAVTPVHTMTGWVWHLPLRRDYDVCMFITAAVDLILAALTTGEEFGGVLGRVGGRSFLMLGTLAVLLLIPLAVTSTRRAHRWLGSYWKKLHRLVYVIWAIVLLHLLLLFGFSGIFVQAVVVSAPLVLLRLPPVRRWWVEARRTHQHRIVRAAIALGLVATFVAGIRPVIAELSFKGRAAFIQQPID